MQLAAGSLSLVACSRALMSWLRPPLECPPRPAVGVAASSTSFGLQMVQSDAQTVDPAPPSPCEVDVAAGNGLMSCPNKRRVAPAERQRKTLARCV